MPDRRSLSTTLTKTSVSLLWFPRPCNDKSTLRPLEADLARHAKHWFRFDKSIDTKAFIRQINVPELSAFGALPYSVSQQTKARAGRLSTFLSASENDEHHLHVATVADLVWMLPQMRRMLSVKAAFIAPLNSLKRSDAAGSMETGPSAENQLYLLERQTLKTCTSRHWRVTPVEDTFNQFKGPIPIILMTHQRPGIPQLAVYQPQPC